MVKTQQYRLKLLLRILLFIVLSFLFLSVTLPNKLYNIKGLFIIHFLFIAIIIISYFFAIFNTIPTIIGKDDSVIIKHLIKRKTYLHTDIEKIQHFEKRHWFYIFETVYSTCIFFKNGDVVFIYDNWYKNYKEIEGYINSITISEDTFTNDNKTLYFKGYAAFSIFGIVITMFPIIIFQIIDRSTIDNNLSSFYLLFFLVLAMLATAFTMYYVGVSKDAFYIKNHLFFFINKRVPLNDILNIRFESHGKYDRIRVWTKNNEMKRYYFSTLSNRTLKELAIILNARGVRVIDDITI